MCLSTIENNKYLSMRILSIGIEGCILRTIRRVCKLYVNRRMTIQWSDYWASISNREKRPIDWLDPRAAYAGPHRLRITLKEATRIWFYRDQGARRSTSYWRKLGGCPLWKRSGANTPERMIHGQSPQSKRHSLAPRCHGSRAGTRSSRQPLPPIRKRKKPGQSVQRVSGR